MHLSKRMLSDDEQIVPLLGANGTHNIDKLVQSLSSNDLLVQYLDIGITEYDESEEDDVMYQIRKLKSQVNMRIPKNSLVIFVSDDSYDTRISGSKDDDCDYGNGMLIGMITDNVHMMMNVDIDISLTLFQADGNIEHRDLVASYMRCEGNEISLYDKWKFWLLTTDEKKGFYKDFSQCNVYIIFATHHLYNKLKEYYDMPK